MKGLETLPVPDGSKKYYFPVSSIIAFTTVARKMVFNGDAMLEKENAYLKQLDSLGIDKELLDNSIEYGRAVGKHILSWASKD